MGEIRVILFGVGRVGSDVARLLSIALDRPIAALLTDLRQRGMSCARECLTWDAKAQATTRVLYWVSRQGSKPDLPPPKTLAASIASRR